MCEQEYMPEHFTERVEISFVASSQQPPTQFSCAFLGVQCYRAVTCACVTMPLLLPQTLPALQDWFLVGHGFQSHAPSYLAGSLIPCLLLGQDLIEVNSQFFLSKSLSKALFVQRADILIQTYTYTYTHTPPTCSWHPSTLMPPSPAPCSVPP